MGEQSNRTFALSDSGWGKLFASRLAYGSTSTARRAFTRSVSTGFRDAWSTAIAAVPFILTGLLAFRPQKDIFAYPLGVGGDFTLDNFAAAWNGPIGGVGLVTNAGSSATIAITALLTNLVVGSPAAYFAKALPPRAKKWFTRLFLVATTTSATDSSPSHAPR